MKKQLYLILLLGILCLTVFSLVGEKNTDVLAYEGNNPQGTVAVETEGNHVFNVMNEILEEDAVSETPCFSDFVSNYGGGIIEGDHLTIYVKGGVDNQELFETKMGEKGVSSDRYDIVAAEYSYSDLELQMQSFWDYRNEKLAEGSSWADDIYSVAICQERNCITVCVSTAIDINDYPELSSALDSICHEIVVLDEEPQKIEETTLRPGMAISTGASIGFRCKFNGEKGIISTAHTTNYTPLNPVSYGGISFGNIIAASYGGSVDFCFI